MAQATVDSIYEELQALKEEIAELKYRVNEDYELSDWVKQRIDEYEEGGVETVSHQEIKEKFA